MPIRSGTRRSVSAERLNNWGLWSREPQYVLDTYGVRRGPTGSFARQCLMARRLTEAGVRFVEICQPGWDHHNNLHKGLTDRCQSIDQPLAALLGLDHEMLTYPYAGRDFRLTDVAGRVVKEIMS